MENKLFRENFDEEQMDVAIFVRSIYSEIITFKFFAQIWDIGETSMFQWTLIQSKNKISFYTNWVTEIDDNLEL